ncbi:MAG: lipopolysaccharide heptosyltransferase II [Chloroflexota bacterium]
MSQEQQPSRQRAKHLLRGGAVVLVYLLCSLLGLVSAIGRAARRLGRPDPSLAPTEVRKILVIRLDLLGDLVMSLPAIAALKRAYPACEISVLALPYAAAVLPMAPDVDHVLTYDVNLVRRPREVLRPANYMRFFRLVRHLRRQRYDLCLSLHGPFACVIAWLTGCPSRFGYRAEAYPFMLTRTLPGGRYGEAKHEVFYSLRLAELAGAQPVSASRAEPRLVVPTREQRRMRQVLAEFEIRPDTVLVVIHPGASNGSAKRWPAEHWARLANRLHGELGAAIVVTGTANEAEVVREVERGCRFKPVILAGQTSVPQLTALLKRADLVLSGDSGPAHLAAAVGTAQVTLFGPTDPTIYRPYSSRATVLHIELACRPCYDATATAECRFGHVNCMRQLLPDAVYDAAVQKLAKRLQRVKP